jgi:Protein of unknown function (DUF3467)
MPFPSPSDDRPDPNENMPAMRARIPEHIARGEISTGVIVVTGGTEYVLDFVRNLPRPNAIVARVILPHLVMPQFIDALAANIELFRNRYGELPGAPSAAVVTQPFQNGTFQSGTGSVSPPTPPTSPLAEINTVDVWPGADATSNPNTNPNLNANQALPPNSAASVGNGSEADSPGASASGPAGGNPPNQLGNAVGSGNPSLLKRQNPQEVYDDLKIRDEILSGAYANAVMIGHGPYEFSFDFITNFYPQSAVSCRVYLASGHIHRLIESLRASWEQLKPRLAQNFPPQPPPPPRNVG